MMRSCFEEVVQGGMDIIGGGWVGTGLLGAVLSWLLLRHLPEKDRTSREMLDAFLGMDERRRKEDIELRKIEREKCERDHRLLADHLVANTKEIVENTKQTLALAREIKGISDSQIKMADSWTKYSSKNEQKT